MSKHDYKKLVCTTAHCFFRSAYIASALGGVKLAKGDNGENIIVEATAWLLIYQLKFYPNEISYVSGLWERVRKSKNLYDIKIFLTLEIMFFGKSESLEIEELYLFECAR